MIAEISHFEALCELFSSGQAAQVASKEHFRSHAVRAHRLSGINTSLLGLNSFHKTEKGKCTFLGYEMVELPHQWHIICIQLITSHPHTNHGSKHEN